MENKTLQQISEKVDTMDDIKEILDSAMAKLTALNSK